VAVAAVLALVVLGAALEAAPGGAPADGATAARLASTGSNRYEYWEVALRAFGGRPVYGVGSGGFTQEWLRERTIPERARDAHSLPIEVAAELGVAGLLALALLVAGLAAGARAAVRRDRALAAGPVAVLAAAAVHACLDWDWEMPALMLVPVVLGGLLLAAGRPAAAPARPPARAALAVLALLLCVPLAVELRSSVLTDRGLRLVLAPKGPPATLRERQLDVLRRAQELNADTTPDLLEARVELAGGRQGRAATILERVTAREPENATAWAGLARALPAEDPRRAQAARRARALMPPQPGDR
jgi:hypothetical protein